MESLQKNEQPVILVIKQKSIEKQKKNWEKNLAKAIHNYYLRLAYKGVLNKDDIACGEKKFRQIYWRKIKTRVPKMVWKKYNKNSKECENLIKEYRDRKGVRLCTGDFIKQTEIDEKFGPFMVRLCEEIKNDQDIKKQYILTGDEYEILITKFQQKFEPLPLSTVKTPPAQPQQQIQTPPAQTQQTIQALPAQPQQPIKTPPAQSLNLNQLDENKEDFDLLQQGNISKPKSNMKIVQHKENPIEGDVEKQNTTQSTQQPTKPNSDQMVTEQLGQNQLPKPDNVDQYFNFEMENVCLVCHHNDDNYYDSSSFDFGQCEDPDFESSDSYSSQAFQQQKRRSQFVDQYDQ